MPTPRPKRARVLVSRLPAHARVRLGAIEAMLYAACAAEQEVSIVAVELHGGYAVACLEGAEAPRAMLGEHELTVRSERLSVLVGAVGATEDVADAAARIADGARDKPALTVQISRPAREVGASPEKSMRTRNAAASRFAPGGAASPARTPAAGRAGAQSSRAAGGGAAAEAEARAAEAEARAAGSEEESAGSEEDELVSPGHKRTRRDGSGERATRARPGAAACGSQACCGAEVGAPSAPSPFTVFEEGGAREGGGGEGGGGGAVDATPNSKPADDGAGGPRSGPGSRLNRQGLSYKCSRCGQPKKGHHCPGGPIPVGQPAFGYDSYVLQTGYDAHGQPTQTLVQAVVQPAPALATALPTHASPPTAAAVQLAAPSIAVVPPVPLALGEQPALARPAAAPLLSGGPLGGPDGSAPPGAALLPAAAAAGSPSGADGRAQQGAAPTRGRPPRPRGKKAAAPDGAAAPALPLPPPSAAGAGPGAPLPGASAHQTMELTDMDLMLSDLAFSATRPPPVLTPEEAAAAARGCTAAPSAVPSVSMPSSLGRELGRLTPSMFTPGGQFSPSMIFSPALLQQIMAGQSPQLTPTGLTPPPAAGAAGASATPTAAAAAADSVAAAAPTGRSRGRAGSSRAAAKASAAASS